MSNRLQKIMPMFLAHPQKWFTMRDMYFGINFRGQVLRSNNIFDDVKYLERIPMPTGRNLRFLREWVFPNPLNKKERFCRVKLQEDLTKEELEFLRNSKNITIFRAKGSNSTFDKEA